MYSSSNDSDIQFQLHFLDCQPDSVKRSLNDKTVLEHLYHAATNRILRFDRSYKRQESNRVTDIDQLSFLSSPVLFVPKNMTRQMPVELTTPDNRKVSIAIGKINTKTHSTPSTEIKTEIESSIPKAPPLPESLDLAIKLQSQAVKSVTLSPDHEMLWANVQKQNVADYFNQSTNSSDAKYPTKVNENTNKNILDARKSYNLAMTYDKLARAIRFYYKSGIIKQATGRFTFRFGPASGFGIILAFTKRSATEIAEAIKSFHSQFTSIELVQHLIQYLPDESEIDVFRRLSTNKDQLSATDRLMYEISQVPFYLERLNTVKFKLTFTDNCLLLNDQLQVVNEACTFLYQSANVRKLLEIILSVLNHLNSTPTHRALTLDDLSKICDLKTSKARIPVMNIVSQICRDREPEIFDIKQHYKLLSSASKIDLTLIQSEIEQIKQQSEQIHSWLPKFEDRTDIQKFLLDCEETLNKLIRNSQMTSEQFHKTVSYFTKQTTSSTVFLAVFAHLIHSLQIQQRTT